MYRLREFYKWFWGYEALDKYDLTLRIMFMVAMIAECLIFLAGGIALISIAIDDILGV